MVTNYFGCEFKNKNMHAVRNTLTVWSQMDLANPQEHKEKRISRTNHRWYLSKRFSEHGW